MKRIQVEITGTTPLLMNNPAQLMDQGNKSFRKRNIVSEPESEAEKTAYKTKTGELYIPNHCVFSMLIHAAKGYKIKNQSLSNILSGTIKIEPEQILLGTKKYEVDAKRVVIQTSSIIRHRARLTDWKASFEIIYDDEWLPNAEKILEEVLQGAGRRVGLLDYRPQKKGWYGTFTVTKWKIVG